MNLKYYLGEKSGPVKTVPTGPAPTPMLCVMRKCLYLKKMTTLTDYVMSNRLINCLFTYFIIIISYNILKSRSSSLNHYIVDIILYTIRVRSLRQKPVYRRNLLMLMYCR